MPGITPWRLFSSVQCMVHREVVWLGHGHWPQHQDRQACKKKGSSPNPGYPQPQKRAINYNWKPRGGLHCDVSHKSDFGNQLIRQLELWNLAQWEILPLVPGKVLWRKCRGGLIAKINQLINRHLCEIFVGSPPLCNTIGPSFFPKQKLNLHIYWLKVHVFVRIWV